MGKIERGRRLRLGGRARAWRDREIDQTPASLPARCRRAFSTLKITSQTGHASDAMLTRYVRDGELFLDNAAGALL